MPGPGHARRQHVAGEHQDPAARREHLVEAEGPGRSAGLAVGHPEEPEQLGVRANAAGLHALADRLERRELGHEPPRRLRAGHLAGGDGSGLEVVAPAREGAEQAGHRLQLVALGEAQLVPWAVLSPPHERARARSAPSSRPARAAIRSRRPRRRRRSARRSPRRARARRGAPREPRCRGTGSRARCRASPPARTGGRTGTTRPSTARAAPEKSVRSPSQSSTFDATHPTVTSRRSASAAAASQPASGTASAATTARSSPRAAAASRFSPAGRLRRGSETTRTPSPAAA